MEEDRLPKKIFTQELEGARRRGRPRKGWKEEVERDLLSAGSEKMEIVGDRWGKIEGYCSTGRVMNGCITFLYDVGNCLPNYTASRPAGS